MMDESINFLSKIFGLLNDGNVFQTQSNEPNSVVEFKHPEELSVSFIATKLLIRLVDDVVCCSD